MCTVTFCLKLMRECYFYEDLTRRVIVTFFSTLELMKVLSQMSHLSVTVTHEGILPSPPKAEKSGVLHTKP